MDIWNKTSGTWINVATVLAGTTIGMLLRGHLPQAIQQTTTQGIGLVTMLIGITLALKLTSVTIGQVDGVVLALVCLVLGGIVGEVGKLEGCLQSLGTWLQRQVKGSSQFTEGFMAASLLFCVGPLTLIGCLNNGLTGDDQLLVLKATMDGIAAIALASSFGVGVGFSALIVLLYQGSLSLAASRLALVLPNPATSPTVMLLTGVGGIIIIGLALNLLDVTRIRVASFLPAFLLCPIASWLADSVS